MAEPLGDVLRRGLERLDLPLSSDQIDTLLIFRSLLARWNSAYNLTAVRDPRQMVVRHLLDSLAVAPYLEGDYFIDVGTGPGLPGVPLAVIFPERQWVLLDSNGKKTRFLFQVKTHLGLNNIDIVGSRVESWTPSRCFDGVLTRAFAELSLMCERCHHLLANTGRLYAMKSQLVDQELDQLPAGFTLEANIALQVPELLESRWLTVIKRQEHMVCP